jgi:hypothetical protein
MAWHAAVRIVDSGGEGKSGVRVTLDFSLMTGATTEYTDGDGWANFSIPPANSTDEFYVDDVFVEGNSVDSDFYIRNGDRKSYVT